MCPSMASALRSEPPSTVVSRSRRRAAAGGWPRRRFVRGEAGRRASPVARATAADEQHRGLYGCWHQHRTTKTEKKEKKKDTVLAALQRTRLVPYTARALRLWSARPPPRPRPSQSLPPHCTPPPPASHPASPLKGCYPCCRRPPAAACSRSSRSYQAACVAATSSSLPRSPMCARLSCERSVRSSVRSASERTCAPLLAFSAACAAASVTTSSAAAAAAAASAAGTDPDRTAGAPEWRVPAWMVVFDGTTAPAAATELSKGCGDGTLQAVSQCQQPGTSVTYTAWLAMYPTRATATPDGQAEVGHLQQPG